MNLEKIVQEKIVDFHVGRTVPKGFMPVKSSTELVVVYRWYAHSYPVLRLAARERDGTIWVFDNITHQWENANAKK